MSPDPDRVRLATEALARARADAWSRGDRPFAGDRPPRAQTDSAERGVATPDASLPVSWLARERREDPERLDEAFGGLLAARGWNERAAVGAVFGKWAQIVGPQLAAHTNPESFDSGVLVLGADSSAWATQLRLLAPDLLRRLAEELGADTVRKIRVRGPSGRQGHVGLRQPRECVTTAKIEGGHADKTAGGRGPI